VLQAHWTYSAVAWSLIVPDGGSVNITEIRGGLSARATLKDLNRRRRVRRMRRVVIASAEGAQRGIGTYSGRTETLLVTLTYAPQSSWDPRHIADYMRALSHYARRERFRFRYQWVIELTQRGVPHYHVLLWVPYGRRIPKPDDSGMWAHGSSRTERARNAVGYLVKYATKGETSSLYSLPKGARLFGVGGGDKSEKLSTHRAGLPMWLLERLPSDARARRVARLGWVCLDTGELHRTPFEVVWFKDDWGVCTVQILKREEVEC
jgi:hypothetical protein